MIHQDLAQGSLLGPLFFSIYANCMPAAVTDASLNMFANNTAHYVAEYDASTAAETMTRE